MQPSTSSKTLGAAGAPDPAAKAGAAGGPLSIAATLRGERILVTGATGFIGLEVIEQAAPAEHDIRAMVRRPSRAALAARCDVETVQIPPTSGAARQSAVPGRTSPES